MDLFHIIDEGVVVLRIRGKRFRQAKVYRRGAMVYAGVGSEFVRLIAHGGTSDPQIGWLDIEAEGVTLSANRTPSVAL